MTKTSTIKLAVALLFAIFSFLITRSSEAGIISGNDPTITAPTVGINYVTGLGNITIDLVSGLSWVDNTLTTNYTVDQISLQFGATGWFPGYRYATVQELSAFWSSAMIVNPNSFVVEDSPAISALQSIWGAGYNAADTKQTISITGDSSGTLRLVGVIINDLTLGDRDFSKADHTAVASTYFGINTGHAIVKSTVVPEPGSLVIFGWMCLVGLLLFRGGVSRYNAACSSNAISNLKCWATSGSGCPNGGPGVSP